MKGAPGAGKSTLARALSSELGWPLIGKDDIKDILDGQTPRAGALAYEIMARIVRRQLTQGLSVICDSPLLAMTYDNLRAIAAAEGASLAIVECRCGNAVIWLQRVEARQAQALPAHHTVTWHGVQRFLAQPEASYPVVDPHLIVDTARPISELAAEVITWLGPFAQ
jgi:predicted kinase